MVEEELARKKNMQEHINQANLCPKSATLDT